LDSRDLLIGWNRFPTADRTAVLVFYAAKELGREVALSVALRKNDTIVGHVECDARVERFLHVDIDEGLRR